MAQWAMQFTPCVTIHGQHHTLLLEVAASLRLWGGAHALLSRLHQGWHDFGWQPPDTITLAYGPTAHHAQWLALNDAEQLPAEPMSDTQMLDNQTFSIQALSQLPITVIEECEPHLDVLERMGIRTIGQLSALPRGGITRRFGKTLLQILDQAHGKSPEVYRWITSVEQFHSRRELSARAESTTLIEQAALRCFHELAAWLLARQAGIQEVVLVLHHDRPPQTPLPLRFAGPTRDIARFERLLSERLARFKVTQPVYEIELHADVTIPLPHTTQDFLGGHVSEQEDLQILIERLEARLGQNQVQRLCVLDEHRPEKSIALQPLHATTKSFTNTYAQKSPHLQSHRPAWLVSPPTRLAMQGHRPSYQGPLQLLCGPERIEAGWWDDTLNGPTQRDYFIARTTNEILLWIFRTPSHEWYLHGFFS